MKTIIIDDEPLAREGLKRLLGACHDVRVVGEASDGKEALDKIISDGFIRPLDQQQEKERPKLHETNKKLGAVKKHVHRRHFQEPVETVEHNHQPEELAHVVSRLLGSRDMFQA